MKNLKRICKITLCLCLAGALAGCGKKETADAKTIVATVGDKEVSLGEANFLLRLQQAETEDYYESMLGGMVEDLYEFSYDGGSTYGEIVKDETIEKMQEYYIAEVKAEEFGISLTEEEKAQIEAAAAAFREANEDYVLEQMMAEQDVIERVLELQLIEIKVRVEMGDPDDYTASMEEWKEDYPLSVEEDVWDTVVFDRSYTLKQYQE